MILNFLVLSAMSLTAPRAWLTVPSFFCKVYTQESGFFLTSRSSAHGWGDFRVLDLAPDTEASADADSLEVQPALFHSNITFRSSSSLT